MVKRVRLNDVTVVKGSASKFKPEYTSQIKEMCKLGLTDVDVALIFRVSPTTVRTWKSAHPEFFDAMQRGKQVADQRVAAQLYKNATGFYYYEEVLDKTWHREYNDDEKLVKAYQITKVVTVKRYFKPETVAQIFFLKNRRPELWRDVQHKITEKDVVTETPAEIMQEFKRRDLVVLDGVFKVVNKSAAK